MATPITSRMPKPAFRPPWFQETHAVLIPARNEEATIGEIVRTFRNHPETPKVFVAIDADTTDNTEKIVWNNGGIAIHTDQRGKGQVINAGMQFIATAKELTPRIILCDGDYTGLDPLHISMITGYNRGMIIGVPDWPDVDVPERVLDAWPRVSGFRCLPWSLIPHDAHGYLLETQLNLLAINMRMPVRLVTMDGLKSPFQWPLSPKRQEELERDQKWGLGNGIL